MILNDLKKAVADAGVVGAGGAGFPTQFKFNEGLDTLVINGAECEPLIFFGLLYYEKRNGTDA